MAIKNIIAMGIGFAAGSTAFIPTYGFSAGAEVEPPVVVAAPATTGGWDTDWAPKRKPRPAEDIPDTLEPATEPALEQAQEPPRRALEARALAQEVQALRARAEVLAAQEKALQRAVKERKAQQAKAAALALALAAIDQQIAEAEAQAAESQAIQSLLARIDEEIQLRQIQLAQAEAEARRQAEIEDENTAITLILGMVL